MNFVIEDFFNDSIKLIFIGCIHTRDPSLILPLKKEIEAFNPDIILVESGFDKAKYRNAEEAIENGGEMGYVSFLANNYNTNLISNDPSFKEEISFVEKKYGRDFAFVYFFVRNRSFEKKMCKYDQNLTDSILIEEIQKNTNWDKFDYSLSNAKKLFQKILSQELNDIDYSDLFNPLLHLNQFNEATRELNLFRDVFMVSLIKELIKTYKKILVIKGEHHLNTSREKIKQIITNV